MDIDKRKKIGLWLIFIGLIAMFLFGLIAGLVVLHPMLIFCAILGLIVCFVGIYFQCAETTNCDKKMYIISLKDLLFKKKKYKIDL